MHNDGAFGRRLRQLRKARDLTQEALAQAAFCALDTVKKIETGRRRPSRQLAAQLADVLGLGVSERAEFLAAARQGDEPEPPAATASVAARRLPRALTPFIGRERELSDLVAGLGDPDARLITIVAPGGMGKTRLALAATEQVRDEKAFLDGVAFAVLAPVGEPTGLDPAIADALGLPLDAGGPRSPRAQLLDYLRTKTLLLVLDNCEHLSQAIAELASAILAEAPGITLLATSRERLELRAAQVVLLDGMGTEVGGALLFAATARTVQAALVLDATTRPQVAAICAQVGGMPLAIELAAGWADTLSLAEIAGELARSDEILTSQAVDLPERQRSVRAVCDATWSRLTPPEQAVFAQVAVFRGGGTRRALQAVTGASLGQLQTLVGKALLRYDPERERYSVHELLRQYAKEQLEADPAAMWGAHARHAAYYLEALAAREAELKGAGQREALERIARDSENVHAAWTWATTHGALDLLAGAVGALSLAYEWLGRSEDGLAAMRQARAAGNPPPAELQTRLLAAQARFTFLRGDRPSALALLAQAQALCDSDPEGVSDVAQAEVLLQLGRCLANQDFGAAQDAYARSQSLFEASDDQWGAAMALSGLGVMIILLSSNYAAARHVLEQSVAHFRTVGEQIGLSEALTNLSMAARYLSYLSESLALGREAHALAQASGNRRLIAQTASNLGAALYWIGANDESCAVLRTALAITLELGHEAELPAISYRLGIATKFLGRYAEARAILSSALAVAQRVDDAAHVCEILSDLSWVALAEGAYQDALRLAEDTIACSEQLGEGWSRLAGYGASALAARGLGDQTRARANALVGLRFALTTGSLVEWGLWAVALLQMDSGELEGAAAAIALAAKMHPIDNRWVEDIGLRELRAALATLPPHRAAAAEARWSQHDFLSGLQELIAELVVKGWGDGVVAAGAQR
jgi:predicted ATPase/transcriptional regulator with XRE-family HTH domain